MRDPDEEFRRVVLYDPTRYPDEESPGGKQQLDIEGLIFIVFIALGIAAALGAA